MAENLGGATEHQANDTPHFHGLLVVATPYKTMTLQKIRDLIAEDFSQVELIKRFVAHVCREDHFKHEEHQQNLTQYEQDF